MKTPDDSRVDLREATDIDANLRAMRLPATLGEFVGERANTLGDQVAACWFEDNQSLTYRELDVAANRLACALLPLGVRKGTHVAVMLPNVAETLIVWTAIGRIGAVMVPANTRYTPTELGFLLNDSDAQFLIIDEEFLALLAQVIDRPEMITEGNVIVRGEARGEQRSLSQLIEDGDGVFISPTPVGSNDLLNIQYTSGTTGFPKGCLLSHEYWMHIGYSLALAREQEREVKNTLVWAPFFYMDGMWQLLASFCQGATAYVARRMSMSAFMGWLRDYRIHVCTFPEPALKAFPESPEDSGLELRYVYSFGWRPEARREVERRFGCLARDGYGMTETGTATIVPTRAGERAYARTCGLPTAERALRIVDEHDQDVAPGERGELWVSGPGLMWGYYKRPAANAEVFRGEWLRTGDLFTRDPDGYYFIVGRIKDMVKRAGENVAAREVEAVLNELSFVAESAIVPVPDALRGEEVKAYLILNGVSPRDVSMEEIFTHCRSQLAPFKVPRYIEYVAELPRTPTGKVAKQRLLTEIDDLTAGAFDRESGRWL